MTTGLTRQGFLALSWAEQKSADFRKVFDPEADTDLIANCIRTYAHKDANASMTIYANGVYCYGCRNRWWPDEFLSDLKDRELATERGARKQPAPKFIPLGQVDVYRSWLWGKAGYSSGYYAHRQNWLLFRGLTEQTCRENWIGHSGEAFTIPIIDPVEGVLAIRYRRDDELASEDRPKYWGTAGANQAMLYQPHSVRMRTSRPAGLILCEGELDALRLSQTGYPAVSLTNGCGALKPEHLSLFKGYKVTVAYDQDAPGRVAADRAVAMLSSGGISARKMMWHSDYKDVTELLQGGQNFHLRMEAAWGYA